MPASPTGRSTSWRWPKRRRRAAAKVETSRVLAIGDSVRTDLKGAATFGIDCLFVTAGIHAEELGGRAQSGYAAIDEDFFGSRP